MRSPAETLDEPARAADAPRARAGEASPAFNGNSIHEHCKRANGTGSARGCAGRVGVVGCGRGAGVYSISWAIRSARPDLKTTRRAVAISEEAWAAPAGVLYSPGVPHLGDEPMLERATEDEMRAMFDR